nr:MAG TPA: hypothetical protein [Caudoviricetes sp.]
MRKNSIDNVKKGLVRIILQAVSVLTEVTL